MSKSSTGIGLLVVSSLAVLAGFAFGYYLTTPKGKKTRTWLRDHVDDLEDWVVDHTEEPREKAKAALHKVKSNIDREIDRTIPDLYKATENLTLDAEELFDR